MPALTRFTDAFQGTQVINVANQEQARITVNLEDAVLQEQKLFSILEVSDDRLNTFRVSETIRTHPFFAMIGGTLQKQATLEWL
jgi:hypothetical protein